MQTKLRKSSQTLAIAIAAFAVTITSVQAFGNQEFLTQAGLNDEQVVAVQEARELRRMGDLKAARDALLDAGIDEETITELRQAHRQHRANHQHRFKVQIAQDLTPQQQDALQVAKAANDRVAVHAILDEAGIERPVKQTGGRYRKDATE